ncbi:DUF2059 domain-containing protein [Flavobacterium sp.]|jgi:hypothetical protein|uniref:DUF2059 domain-containing protein n=1 Tax=Flavobacterium sp. TaxID=239 RepID=UPI0037BF8A83
MKKIILALVFVLSTQFVAAQDAAFKADVMKVIKMTGSDAQMALAKKQIIDLIPEAKHAEFSKEFEATMPAFYDKMAEVYMKEYTHAEIKEMIKFYETPIGLKITQKSGVMTEQSMLAAQEWGAGLQEMLMKYMQ